MCNSHVFMCLCSSPDGSLLSKLVSPSLRHFQENRGENLKLKTFLRVRHLPKQHVFFIQMLRGVTTMLNLSFFIYLSRIFRDMFVWGREQLQGRHFKVGIRQEMPPLEHFYTRTQQP